VNKNAYQMLGLLKSASLAEIEMAYALKTYKESDKTKYNQAIDSLRDELKRAKLNMETPFYLPSPWSMAHVNYLPEHHSLVLKNLNGEFTPCESEEAWLNMLSGVAFYYLGDLEQALINFLKAEVSLLDDPHLYFNIALTYHNLNQKEKASAYIKRVLPTLSYIELILALKTFPLNRQNIITLLLEKSGISSKTYWQALNLLTTYNEIDLAEKIWEKAVRVYPENLDLQFYILQICLDQTDFTKATTYYHELSSKFFNTKPQREAARLLTRVGIFWFNNLWEAQEHVIAIKVLGQVTSINQSYEKLLAESVNIFLATNPKNIDKQKIEPEILKAKSYNARHMF